jgi:hypothetical protein
VNKLDRCILGVSLGGSNAATFHGAKLEALVRWIAARAKHADGWSPKAGSRRCPSR